MAPCHPAMAGLSRGKALAQPPQTFGGRAERGVAQVAHAVEPARQLAALFTPKET